MNGPPQFTIYHILFKTILVEKMVTEINISHDIVVLINGIEEKKLRVRDTVIYLVTNSIYLHHPLDFLTLNG